MTEQAKPITCGCGTCHLDGWDKKDCYWWTAWGPGGTTIAEYRPPGFGDSCNTAGHCPKCGRKLGFDADGNPTVGPSYAELERAVRVLVTELAISDAKLACDCSAQGIAKKVRGVYKWLAERKSISVVDSLSGPMAKQNFGAGGPDGARAFADALPEQ